MNATDGRPPSARNKANYIAAKAAYNARELEQGHRVAVVGSDRESAAAARDRARERDGAADRCADRVSDGRTDVDPAMLSARVGIGAEREGPEDRPVDGPRPCRRRAGDHERDECEDDEQPQVHPFDLLRCPI